MGRTWRLAGLWAFSTATAVGVGFAAAGLVEYPPSVSAGPRPDFVLPGPRPSASPAPAAAAPPQPSHRAASRDLADPPDPPPVEAPLPVPTTGGWTLGLSTLGGYVSGTCGLGGIRLSASPSVGWVVTHLAEAGEPSAEVEFRRIGTGAGALTVEAWCDGVRPRMVVDREDADDRGDRPP